MCFSPHSRLHASILSFLVEQTTTTKWILGLLRQTAELHSSCPIAAAAVASIYRNRSKETCIPPCMTHAQWIMNGAATTADCHDQSSLWYAIFYPASACGHGTQVTRLLTYVELSLDTVSDRAARGMQIVSKSTCCNQRVFHTRCRDVYNSHGSRKRV